MSANSRVIVVVNKYWECDPVCWVLTNKYINETCSVKLAWPELLTYPSYGPVKIDPAIGYSIPRMVYTGKERTIEIWCISDLLSRFPDTPDYQSSSERKMDVMGEIFTYEDGPIEAVVAVGTASSGPFCPEYEGMAQNNINGSVIVGSGVFLHDGHPATDPNPDSGWRCSYFDRIMQSSLWNSGNDRSSRLFDTAIFKNLESLLLCPPTNPATNGQHVYIDASYIALSDINVTDYTEYSKKDLETGNSFTSHYPGNSNGVSLETTHGLIYAQAKDFLRGDDPPFMFISGVVDRFTHFDPDVKTKTYAQNVTGAHNAGVVVAVLLAALM